VGFASTRWRKKTALARASFSAMMQNLEAYLACCQLGITMASLGLGWVGEPTVAALLTPVMTPLGMSEPALHFTSFIVGFLVFSSLHIVLGEQVPKTLAIRKPEPVSLWVAYPLHISYVLFYPLNWLLNAASRSILKAARHRGRPAARNPQRCRDRRARRSLGRARQDAEAGQANTCRTFSALATSKCAT
jgi:CBS domain containing-hemolysin-like protein